MSKPVGNILLSGVGALFAQGSLHLELMRVEWALEKLRYRRMLRLVLIGVPMFACSLLSIGVLVMMLSWNTAYKFPAAVVLVVLYSAGTLFVYYRLRQEDILGNTAFAESKREIASDIALIRDRLGK